MKIKNFNPIYSILQDNLFTETEIAKSKNDSYNLAFCLANDFLFNQTQLNEHVMFLEKHIFYKGFQPKDAVAMSVCLHLAEKKRTKLSNKFIKSAIECIEEVSDIHIPLNAKIIVYFFVKNIKRANVSSLKELLLTKQQEYRQSNIGDLIDIEWALGRNYFSEEVWNNLDVCEHSLNLSKLSKLAQILFELEYYEQFEKTINLIERKIRERNSKSSLPIISLLIYQAEKLISTNLTGGRLTSMLELLKKQNRSWAQLVTEIQENGVTLNLGGIVNLSPLVAEESSLALTILEKSGRKELYQMTENERKKLQDYDKMVNDQTILIPSQAVKSFIFYSLIWAIGTVIYFNLYGSNQLHLILTNINVFSNTRVVPEQISDFYSPPIAILLILKYYYYSWRYLKINRSFGKNAMLQSLFSWKPF